jgi:hypothetical protein
MNKTRRSRGGFSLFKKNKNKKSNTFEVLNPIKIKQEERKKQEKAKQELNKMVKNLEKLFGGHRTRKQQKSRRRH